MKLSRLMIILALLFCTYCLLKPAKANAESASWLRTNTSNALNPKISAIADFVGQTGPGQTNKFSLRETELAVQAEVDPYARADIFLALHDGESIEVEEGYVTLLALPGGFQARGGKFLANFGKLNMVHTHELPQVNRPLVLESFLGEEGLNDTGIELSRIFTPLNTFMEFSYAFINGLGEDHHHQSEAVTTTITDDNGNPVEVEVHQPEEDEDSPRTIRNFAHVARMRTFKDITNNSNIELGVSGALHEPKGEEQRRMGGVDVTFRWKPTQEGQYKGFIWRTEALTSRRKLPEEIDFLTGTVAMPETVVRSGGGYSYMEVQLGRRWRVGVRGDYLEDPESTDLLITRSVSPVITFYTSEFNRIRGQYQYRDLPFGEHDHTGFLQWTVVVGPHGAHPF